MTRPTATAAVAIGLALAAAATAQDPPKPEPRFPGPTKEGFLLPNGWTVTPAGTQV